MSTSKEYMQFVLDQLEGFPDAHIPQNVRRIHGLICREGPSCSSVTTVQWCKKLPELAELMRGAPDGLPYEGARVHSVLDLEDRELVRQVMDILLRVTPLPKRRK